MEEDVVPSAGMFGGCVDAHQSALHFTGNVTPQPAPVFVVEASFYVAS